MTKAVILAIAVFVAIIFPTKVLASDSINCPNRYVTLVNPVRSRSFWLDKTVNPISTQYAAAKKYNFPVTWLLQYDVLQDSQLISVINGFDKKDERGVFLEVTKGLAKEAGVKFDDSRRWSDPSVVFLSAYTQSERRRLVDTLYLNFKEKFGYFPRSVGAWWIDSYSLNYIKRKYGLNTILIVADQKTTDSYGVWGQWWGVPYLPVKENVLVPAKNGGLGAVVIQWAQRDPQLAFGPDASFSNFSLQANDYIRNGKDTVYFANLAKTYLNCTSPVGQITIGMETGMEAVYFHDEYLKQLELLSKIPSLNFVTMSEFSDKYKKIGNPSEVKIGGWVMNKNSRTNANLGESITYPKLIAFNDYFLSDKSSFLERTLPLRAPTKSGVSKVILYFIFGLLFLYTLLKKQIMIFVLSTLFILSAYLIIFMAQEKYGWSVYYGFVFPKIVLFQTITYLFSISILFPFLKSGLKWLKNKVVFLALLPLSFGIDGLLMNIRTSVIDSNRFLGVQFFNHICGINLPKINPRCFTGIVTDFFYKLPYDKIFNAQAIYMFLYPIAHIFLAGMLYFLFKRIKGMAGKFGIVALGFLYLWFIHTILSMDPVSIVAITN